MKPTLEKRNVVSLVSIIAALAAFNFGRSSYCAAIPEPSNPARGRVPGGRNG